MPHPPRTDLGWTLGAAFRTSQTPAQARHGHIVHSPGYEPAQVDTGVMATRPAAVNDPLRIEVGDIPRERHGRSVAPNESPTANPGFNYWTGLSAY